MMDQLIEQSHYRDSAGRAIARVQRQSILFAARPCAHARKVWHLLHGDPSQPSRRPDSRLLRWECAPESWWHRNGAGLADQGAAGRGVRLGCEHGAGSSERNGDGQGAQHVAYGGLVRDRPECDGGAGCRQSNQSAIGCISRRKGDVVGPRRFLRGSGFANGDVTAWDWADLIQAAYLNRVSLSATGFYKTPDIHFDRATG